MTLLVVSRRTSREKIQRLSGEVHVLDVTSRGQAPWRRFSPFYPHGGIPVPFSPGQVSASVEGIWQGLKVFERMDVDPSKFAITTMRGIKRSSRSYGSVLGHRAGIAGDSLLPYVQARREIYLPSYHWVLQHRLEDLLTTISNLEREKPVILLDYETNCEIEDISRPLSHAGLIKRYLEGRWPPR